MENHTGPKKKGDEMETRVLYDIGILKSQPSGRLG